MKFSVGWFSLREHDEVLGFHTTKVLGWGPIKGRVFRFSGAPRTFWGKMKFSEHVLGAIRIGLRPILIVRGFRNENAHFVLGGLKSSPYAPRKLQKRVFKTRRAVSERKVVLLFGKTRRYAVNENSLRELNLVRPSILNRE